jgi:hypothetical protein
LAPENSGNDGFIYGQMRAITYSNILCRKPLRLEALTPQPFKSDTANGLFVLAAAVAAAALLSFLARGSIYQSAARAVRSVG